MSKRPSAESTCNLSAVLRPSKASVILQETKFLSATSTYPIQTKTTKKKTVRDWSNLGQWLFRILFSPTLTLNGVTRNFPQISSCMNDANTTFRSPNDVRCWSSDNLQTFQDVCPRLDARDAGLSSLKLATTPPSSVWFIATVGLVSFFIWYHDDHRYFVSYN